MELTGDHCHLPHVSFQAISNSDAVEAKVGDAFHLAVSKVRTPNLKTNWSTRTRHYQ
jgi:hypothetical protein